MTSTEYPRRFDAVLFDFGGVVASSPFTLIRTMGAAGGHDPDEVLELLLGPYAEDTDHPWHRAERGEVSLVEYLEFVRSECKARGITLQPPEGGFMESLSVHQPVVDAIRGLRADGYKTGLVTNNAREVGTSWKAMVPLDELFDVVVDSSEVGMRKPDPRIYRHACEALEVDPERSVFLDDAPGNVAGAEAVGMVGILVDDDVVAALDALAAALGPTSWRAQSG